MILEIELILRRMKFEEVSFSTKTTRTNLEKTITYMNKTEEDNYENDFNFHFISEVRELKET